MSDTILLGHGSGGRMMHELVRTRLVPAFDITELGDSVVCALPSGARIAMTTDSYVVSPIFFPGGDIGDLAVNGTVNDLLMSGARPLYLTAGFVIEEGLPMAELDRITASMRRAAEAAQVKIVAGDTKVVDRGKADRIFINTAGVGIMPEGVELSARNIRPGDRIIISGSIGRHGVAVMGQRSGLSFDPPVLSDTAALNNVAAALLSRPGLRAMRDPTRGGLATTLKEFALESGLCMRIHEKLVPVPPAVRGACDLLGLDPLYVANEGILVAVVSADMSEYFLSAMRQTAEGSGSALIGEVLEAPAKGVLIKTEIGGTRMADMLEGQQLPRIC